MGAEEAQPGHHSIILSPNTPATPNPANIGSELPLTSTTFGALDLWLCAILLVTAPVEAPVLSPLVPVPVPLGLTTLVLMIVPEPLKLMVGSLEVLDD